MRTPLRYELSQVGPVILCYTQAPRSGNAEQPGKGPPQLDKAGCPPALLVANRFAQVSVEHWAIDCLRESVEQEGDDARSRVAIALRL